MACRLFCYGAMTEKPELDDGHLRIANEITEALSRTYLSSYESQFLWCLFRFTYGWQKKADWISLSQIAEMTGIRMGHVSRTKKKLLTRRIVTQIGNKLAFNKYYSQWRRLPKQVTTEIVTQTGKQLPIQATPIQVTDPPPVQVITPPPKQEHTKESSTKDIFTKESSADDFNWAELQEQYTEGAERIGVCDRAYCEKTFAQVGMLTPADRDEVGRKVRWFITWARCNSVNKHDKARVIHGEIASLVNDRGLIRSQLSPVEQHKRYET